FAQLLVNELPDVNVVFFGFHCLGCCFEHQLGFPLAMKKREISLPHVAVGSGKALSDLKKR
ncbi:MAG: hypothetical protein II453_16420, partial [Alphaproteobacteria bacterium]|nr:hypothetical protein [Alphaproteobacteria bacterium]